MVVLLGLAGSGKTYALRSISRDFGGAMVHASFDFDRRQPATTVEALTRITFALSRRWPVRGRPKFARFSLGLIAVQADLDGMSHEQAREKLRALIRRFRWNRGVDWIAARVEPLVNAAQAVGVLSPGLAEAVKVALPPLIRAAGSQLTSKAERWHGDFPEANRAGPLDALVTLNAQAREQPATMTGWLTEAFLADVRESHARLARRDPKSLCACPNKTEKKDRHYHNWTLLLDNLDHGGGARFIDDLLAAQARYLRGHYGVHDPLLIIGTSGRWNPDLATGWRPPWNSEPRESDGLRTIPRCDDASYQEWADVRMPRRHYPVLLEPLTIGETAKVLETDELTVRSKLAQRATGGLPAALRVLEPLLGNREPRPGARDVLRPSDPKPPEAEVWRSRLDDLRLAKHLSDIGVDEFVTAAPFATAPWLVPADATSLISQPHVGRILTELRVSLWVNAPAQGGGTADYAELHPWIARTLVAALAARQSPPDGPSYEAQFQSLLNDPDTLADPARKAYCQLALGQISDVISLFEATFNSGPHRRWVDRLRLVTRAPDNKPLDQDSYPLYEELVELDIRNVPDGRSPVGNIVRRLIAARWLAANPFATPDLVLKHIIEEAYAALPDWSQQADVMALDGAAKRDLREFFFAN
ncbi:MAG TPA: hypothetical protein VGJ13_02235 [Pseudonocardiaceae bacterium]